MKRSSWVAIGSLAIAFSIAGCESLRPGYGWTVLIDGASGLENWNRVGDANWRAEGGAIVADKGKGGFLVSKESYRDFEIRAEFWAASDTNSGIFIRAADPNKIGAASSYEVNIWDTRPDPKYGTGGIVDVASVPVPVPLPYKAGGRWNSFEIYANGPHLTVKFNGTVTVAVRDDKHAAGPFALQFGNGANNAPGGPIKWRKVEIKPL